MRAHILDLISQDDAKIAVQVALVVAKIARADFPREWPSLVPDLLARASGGNAGGAGAGGAASSASATAAAALAARRAYLVLHHVLKELASKRLAADQRSFAEVRVGGRRPTVATGFALLAVLSA